MILTSKIIFQTCPSMHLSIDYGVNSAFPGYLPDFDRSTCFITECMYLTHSITISNNKEHCSAMYNKRRWLQSATAFLPKLVYLCMLDWPAQLSFSDHLHWLSIFSFKKKRLTFLGLRNWWIDDHDSILCFCLQASFKRTGIEIGSRWTILQPIYVVMFYSGHCSKWQFAAVEKKYTHSCMNCSLVSMRPLIWQMAMTLPVHQAMSNHLHPGVRWRYQEIRLSGWHEKQVKSPHTCPRAVWFYGAHVQLKFWNWKTRVTSFDLSTKSEWCHLHIWA